MAVSAYGSIGPLLVWVAATTAPSFEEWNDYCELARRKSSEAKAAGGPLRILIACDGASPNAAQRKAVMDGFGGNKVRTVVVSSSSVLRGVATIFRWLGNDIDCFTPPDILKALGQLQIGLDEVESVWKQVLGLAAQVDGGVRSIEEARPFVARAVDRRASA